MNLLTEINKAIPGSENTPTIHCTVFEDNKGCIDLANTPRMRPRTKHIGLKYHHFRKHVLDKTVLIKYVDTKEQIADLFTKALNEVQFEFLREIFML